MPLEGHGMVYFHRDSLGVVSRLYKEADFTNTAARSSRGRSRKVHPLCTLGTWNRLLLVLSASNGAQSGRSWRMLSGGCRESAKEYAASAIPRFDWAIDDSSRSTSGSDSTTGLRIRGCSLKSVKCVPFWPTSANHGRKVQVHHSQPRT